MEPPRAEPARVEPPRAEPAPVEAPPPEPQEPWTPRRAWLRLLGSLSAIARTDVAEMAAFLGWENGTVTLAVRSERHRVRVLDVLREVDLGACFPGFRQLVVRVDGEAGRTGRERRSEADQQRLVDAREAAEASPAVRRLLAAFGARIEHVEPPPAPAETPLEAWVEDDEPAADP